MIRIMTIVKEVIITAEVEAMTVPRLGAHYLLPTVCVMKALCSAAPAPRYEENGKQSFRRKA